MTTEILSTKLPLIFITFSVHKWLLSHSKQELELDYQHQKWQGLSTILQFSFVLPSIHCLDPVPAKFCYSLA